MPDVDERRAMAATLAFGSSKDKQKLDSHLQTLISLFWGDSVAVEYRAVCSQS